MPSWYAQGQLYLYLFTYISQSLVLNDTIKTVINDTYTCIIYKNVHTSIILINTLYVTPYDHPLTSGYNYTHTSEQSAGETTI